MVRVRVVWVRVRVVRVSVRIVRFRKLSSSWRV